MSAVATAAPDPDDELAADVSYQDGFADAKQAIDGYKAETSRLVRLHAFLGDFTCRNVPMGEVCVDPIAEIADDDITSARNLALVAAFTAIRRIADES